MGHYLFLLLRLSISSRFATGLSFLSSGFFVSISAFWISGFLSSGFLISEFLVLLIFLSKIDVMELSFVGPSLPALPMPCLLISRFLDDCAAWPMLNSVFINFCILLLSAAWVAAIPANTARF